MKTQWHNAYIRWFDNLSGEGFVKVPSLNKEYFVHWSADVRANGSGPKKLWVAYESLDLVQVQIYQDYGWAQVDKLRLSNWTTRENLLTDMLMSFFDSSAFDSYSENWFDFCLSNLLSECTKQ